MSGEPHCRRRIAHGFVSPRRCSERVLSRQSLASPVGRRWSLAREENSCSLAAAVCSGRMVTLARLRLATKACSDLHHSPPIGSHWGSHRGLRLGARLGPASNYQLDMHSALSRLLLPTAEHCLAAVRLQRQTWHLPAGWELVMPTLPEKIPAAGWREWVVEGRSENNAGYRPRSLRERSAEGAWWSHCC